MKGDQKKKETNIIERLKKKTFENKLELKVRVAFFYQIWFH